MTLPIYGITVINSDLDNMFKREFARLAKGIRSPKTKFPAIQPSLFLPEQTTTAINICARPLVRWGKNREMCFVFSTHFANVNGTAEKLWTCINTGADALPMLIDLLTILDIKDKVLYPVRLLTLNYWPAILCADKEIDVAADADMDECVKMEHMCVDKVFPLHVAQTEVEKMEQIIYMCDKGEIKAVTRQERRRKSRAVKKAIQKEHNRRQKMQMMTTGS